MHLIILEGENKTGKTTIAKLLTNEHHFKYVKCSQPKGDPYVEYMDLLLKIQRHQDDTVIDRFLYGEFVYGPLYRGKSALTETQRRNIELKTLAVADTVSLIYCVDDAKNIAGRFKTDGEEFADVKKIQKTLDLYEKELVLKEYIFNTYMHQMMAVNDLSRSKNLQIVVDNVNLARPYHFKTAVGNTTEPTFVLVGEQHNDELKTGYQKYAQPFDFGVSAKYLFDELRRAKVSIRDVMLINSDSSELKKLKFFHEHKHVIALGRVADKRLTAHGIIHLTAGHPSYERRFHGKRHHLAKLFNKLK